MACGNRLQVSNTERVNSKMHYSGAGSSLKRFEPSIWSEVLLKPFRTEAYGLGNFPTCSQADRLSFFAYADLPPRTKHLFVSPAAKPSMAA
jgi:hypothetical protein